MPPCTIALVSDYLQPRTFLHRHRKRVLEPRDAREEPEEGSIFRTEQEARTVKPDAPARLD